MGSSAGVPVPGWSYREWLPILEKAYSEQGKPDTFDQRARQTISQVLGAEQLSDTPALTRPSVLYRYADETLEQASDVDKLLWRMGPENSAQLQDFFCANCSMSWIGSAQGNGVNRSYTPLINSPGNHRREIAHSLPAHSSIVPG